MIHTHISRENQPAVFNPPQGFCPPQELMAAGDGATEFHDFENGGIGEGDGTKDVSDKIENEDQVSKVLGFSNSSEVQPYQGVDVSVLDDDDDVILQLSEKSF